MENIAKKKLDSLIKESKIRDCEDPNNFTVSTLPSSGKAGLKSDSKKVNLCLIVLVFHCLLNISYIDYSFIAEFMQLMMMPGEHHCQIHKLFILLTQQLEHEMYSEMTFQQKEFDFPL